MDRTGKKRNKLQTDIWLLDRELTVLAIDTVIVADMALFEPSISGDQTEMKQMLLERSHLLDKQREKQRQKYQQTGLVTAEDEHEWDKQQEFTAQLRYLLESLTTNPNLLENLRALKDYLRGHEEAKPGRLSDIYKLIKKRALPQAEVDALLR